MAYWGDGPTLEQRLDLQTSGCLLTEAEAGTHGIESFAQASEQMINGFHAEGDRRCVSGGSNGICSQHLAEQLPKQWGRESVTGQDVGQEDGKSCAAASPQAPVAAKDSLARMICPSCVAGSLP